MTTEATPVVLVADDEPGMLALVGQHIKTMGYRVLEASDGEQAWSLAQEHLPDLVILDVMMPGMSGWEVCRKIREDIALAHTAIIMLTGIGENLNELTSPLYGADSYIDKPFKFPELDEKVRGALTKRRGSRPGLARTEPDGPDVANGNGNHTLLSSSEGAPSSPPTAAEVDDSWDDEPSEVTNGHDESIVLVQTGIGRSAKAKPTSKSKPAKAKASAKPKTKAKPKKVSAKAKPKPKKASAKPAAKSKAKPKKASAKPAAKSKAKAKPKKAAKKPSAKSRKGKKR
jgi:CheY-like chemotaxis protein